MSHRWLDVLIHAEKIVGVVFIFEFDQALMIGPKGCGGRFGVTGKVGVESAR